MVIKFAQQQEMSRYLVMTPRLEMAINFLQLSRMEFIEKIKEEIAVNPLLEDLQQDHVDDTSCVIKDKMNMYDGDFEIAFNLYAGSYTNYKENWFWSENNYDIRPNENMSLQESLSDHLFYQLLSIVLTDEERKICSFIIGNLSQDGYLDLSIIDIARQIRADRYLVERTLKLMQSLDPAGVCARNLEECLLIQARRTDIKRDLVTEIISNNLVDLKNKNYKAISKSLGVGLKDVHTAANIISSFDPRPGRRFYYELTEYIVPDIYVYESDGDFSIILNNSGLPRLNINSQYKEAIFNDKFDMSVKKFLRNKMHSAVWMIKTIQQRQRTIYKVMVSILHLQKDFFKKGADYLKPMVLKEVAKDIGMHESTVSRVTSNKYVCTHHGVFELKYFFDGFVKCLDGTMVSSASVHKKIKNIIENEDSFKPYSDSKISKLLKLENISIARRTVTKYRETMRIISSSMRKRF